MHLRMLARPRSVSGDAIRRPLVAAAWLVVTACGGEGEQACNPTDPSCGNDTNIAAIDVSSPIDSVVAVGQVVQMDAVATAENGAPVSASFSWASAPSSVAIVDGTGMLSAQTTGSAVVRASAEGVTGSVTMVVVDADLEAARVLVQDPFFMSAVEGLSTGTRSELEATLSTCTTGLDEGNIVQARDCVAEALATPPDDGTDTALLGVLSLHFEHVARHLGL